MMLLSSRIAWWCATGGGIGYLPAPGTCATVLLGLPAWYLWHCYMPKGYIALLCLSLATIGCIVIINRALVTDPYQRCDPQEIVLDEIIAVVWAFYGRPIHLYTLIVGICIFRILDITKIFPVYLGEALPNAYGVVADDLIAATLTNLCIYLLWG